MFRSGNLPNQISSIFVTLGHIGLLMTLVDQGLFSDLMARFTPVGRMAFTS
jgi:uncharacterized membrane protein YeiB